MSGYTIREIVSKLTGPIDAVGDSGIDAKRYVNLQAKTALVETLLEEIAFAARDRDSHVHSVKKIGESAQKFLDFVGEEYAPKVSP